MKTIPRALCVIAKRYHSSSTNKISNFGHLSRYLVEEGVPSLMQENFDPKYVSSDVRLRLLPTLHPGLPMIQGMTSYNAFLSTVRLFLGKVILQNSCKIVVRRSISKPEEQAIYCPQYRCVTANDKLIMRWQTYSADAESFNDGTHLQGIFIFEYNEDNTKLLVHTIDDVEIINFEKGQRISSKNVFAC